MDFVWIINRNDKPIDICVEEWGRFVVLPVNRPVQLPKQKALTLVSTLYNVKTCPDPEKYFDNRVQRVVIQRDGGIGDLLLLEPVIRQMKQDVNREITVVTLNPEVYANHPDIKQVIKANHKSNTPIKQQDYDFWYDYRNYSETSPDRAKKHRTDVYAGMNDTKINDKNPRLYFKKDERNTVFEKQEGKTYIGLACDGSHSYRRYDRGIELTKYILDNDPDAIVVILGAWNFVKIEPNDRIIDLQGKTDVREMINVVRDLDYLFSVDTGILHVGMTVHTPTVGLFSICSPEFRTAYYDGPKRIIRKEIPCKGCGDFHMLDCKFGDKHKNPTWIPACLDVQPDEIYKLIKEMDKTPERRIFISDSENSKPIPNDIAIKMGSSKIWMPIIVLNEEKNLPRFIDLVMSHPVIEKVIAIDGGSTDKTVELLQSAGAMVYVHPYDRNYHDMQAMQRNYSCSFVPDGQKIIIMDIDECFSEELWDYLYEFVDSKIDYGQVSRRTFNYYADIRDLNKAIKDYPDYQPRLFTWNRKFKWACSPHHQVYNAPAPFKVNKDIIHFEKEGKDRDALEKQWSEMQAKTREVYG